MLGVQKASLAEINRAPIGNNGYSSRFIVDKTQVVQTTHKNLNGYVSVNRSEGLQILINEKFTGLLEDFLVTSCG